MLEVKSVLPDAVKHVSGSGLVGAAVAVVVGVTVKRGREMGWGAPVDIGVLFLQGNARVLGWGERLANCVH